MNMDMDKRIKKLEEEILTHQQELQTINLRQQELIQLIISKRGGITELQLIKNDNDK